MHGILYFLYDLFSDENEGEDEGPTYENSGEGRPFLCPS